MWFQVVSKVVSILTIQVSILTIPKKWFKVVLNVVSSGCRGAGARSRARAGGPGGSSVITHTTPMKVGLAQCLVVGCRARHLAEPAACPRLRLSEDNQRLSNQEVLHLRCCAIWPPALRSDGFPLPFPKHTGQWKARASAMVTYEPSSYDRPWSSHISRSSSSPQKPE